MSNEKKSIQFEIVDLAIVIGFLGSVFSIVILSNGDEIVWKNRFFSFDPPQTPKSYLNGPEGEITITRKWFPELSYCNGEQLYQQNFQIGWEKCREAFFIGESWHSAPQDWVGGIRKPDSCWDVFDCFRARSDGWRKCSEEIALHLSQQQKGDEFRASIGYSRRQHIALPILVMFICLVCFECRRNRNTVSK